MLIHKEFDYQPLSREETPAGRMYLVEGAHLPSVTTILSQTADHTSLDQWMESVGQARADEIRSEAAVIGTAMHTNLENHILGLPMAGPLLPRLLAQNVIKMGFPKLKKIVGSEVALYSRGLYAGTTDLVSYLNTGELAIVDFKNSRSPKSLETIVDYRCQLAAYALAHDEMFGTNIRTGVVMIAVRDGSYQEFIFRDQEFDKCIEEWLARLSQFRNQSVNS